MKSERLWSSLSGWGAVVLTILGIHRWVVVGTTVWGVVPGEWWARALVTLGLALGVVWASFHWDSIRERTKAWKSGGGLNTAAVTLGLLVVLVGVNVYARRRLPLRWDLTKNQRYTLSERSRQVLKSLSGKVEASVFVPTGGQVSTARDLFRQYEDAGANFHWNYYDPLKDQAAVLQKNPALDAGTLSGALIEYNGKRQNITEFTEKEITSAILKLTRTTPRKILFLDGHGEPGINPGAGSADQSVGQLVQDLQALEWPVETVQLYGDKVAPLEPAEVAVLVIAGPEREPAPQEMKRIEEFLQKGGRVLLLLNPSGANFAGFLKQWGIQTTSDLVLDLTLNGLVRLDVDRGAHESVRAARRVLFKPMRSVKASTPAPAGVTVTELLRTGDATQTVSNYQPGKPVDLRGAQAGSVPVAALAERKIGAGENEKTARLIVVGEDDFITDQLAALPTMYNLALGSSLINYLAEEDALVAIPPRDENTEQAFLTPDQARMIQLVAFYDFPLLALLLALLVYLKRR